MRKIGLATAVFLLAASNPAAAQTIYIAGDSTATDRGPSSYPELGWGMMLPCGLTTGATVRNFAKGGRSTKTFIEEGRLDRILERLVPGDAVLIQFGHNDANHKRPERYVAAEGAFTDNLRRFVTSIREKGGLPILLTPVTRRSFENGKAKADFPAYSAATRAVAADMKVPLIDLESLSRKWLDQVGVEESKHYYLHYTAADGIPRWPKGKSDNTHFSEIGARAIANIVAGALRDLGLPVSRLVLQHRPDLTRDKPVGSSQCH